MSDQPLNFAAQFLIAGTSFIKKRRARFTFSLQRRVVGSLDKQPAFLNHYEFGISLSLRRSHDLASRQSRLTVSCDTVSASAISFSFRPPKKRISTTLPFLSSISLRALNASSSATRSSPRSLVITIVSSSDTCCAPPPRF